MITKETAHYSKEDLDLKYIYTYVTSQHAPYLGFLIVEDIAFWKILPFLFYVQDCGCVTERMRKKILGDKHDNMEDIEVK